MLIQGDNLEALKALLPFYAGRVKCIYIDPPYNTRSAFEQYDDNPLVAVREREVTLKYRRPTEAEVELLTPEPGGSPCSM